MPGIENPVVVSEDKKAPEIVAEAGKFVYLSPIKTPAVLSAVRVRTKTPFGSLHATITVDLKQDRELEIFSQLGRSGSMITAELEGICRISSLYLRAGGNIKDIIKQLSGIGSAYAFTDASNKESTSVPDLLAKALKKYITAKQKHGLKVLVLGEADVEE